MRRVDVRSTCRKLCQILSEALLCTPLLIGRGMDNDDGDNVLVDDDNILYLCAKIKWNQFYLKKPTYDVGRCLVR